MRSTRSLRNSWPLAERMPDTEYGYKERGGDPYCYPGTTILRNKAGIRDAKKLSDYERRLTRLELLTLADSPIDGDFDLTHLRAIHRCLFSVIYEWAGEIRSGDFLAKASSLFCIGSYIEINAERIFKELHDKRLLVGLPKDDFVREMAYFMGEVNALHPFREGNGRTSREFFRELALNAGWELNFGDIDKGALLRADIEAFKGRYDMLIEILRDNCTEMER